MGKLTDDLHGIFMAAAVAAATFALGCEGSKQSTTTAAASATGGKPSGSEGSSHKANFFVSSDTSKTGNLGGLAGADARCSALATAAGFTQKTWHAYLSVEHGSDGAPVHARDRIGSGPWYNAKGVLVASDLTALHARVGDAAVFVDEHGNKIPGQWQGSPQPVEHDILTGSNADGTVMAGQNCADWTSDQAGTTAQVGHSDGLGPGMNANAPYSSWNSSHPNAGCNDTAPRGGAGRIYCFGVD
jgi:hypothetical protein